MDATFVVEVVDVVSRTGELDARPGDRCIVDLHLARAAQCRIDVVCPGIEKHSTTPACPTPQIDSAIEAHWAGVDFDGQLLTVDVDDAHRGQITARLDSWRW